MDIDKNIDQVLLDDFPPPSWEEWLKAVEDTLKGADFEKVMHTKTYEGITLKPIYRKEDLAKLAFLNTEPGSAPYLRGNDPATRLKEGWLVAQAQHETDLKKLNAIILDELSRGLTAVNLDIKTEDKTSGIVVTSADDFETILQGVDLQAAPLFLQADLSQIELLNYFQDYCLRNAINLRSLRGSIGFDPTGELARKGSLPMDLHAAWDNMLKVVKWADQNAPGFRVISIDTRTYEEAGASSVQELAFALATAIGYINGLLQAGFKIDQIAPLFQVKISLGSNLFMEIAKVRSFRLLWAEMIRHYDGNDQSQKIWIHGRTASFNKSVFDIHTNILRTGTETFAGVIGGVDSMEVDCFDSLVKASSEFSRRIARNQQILMAEEAHLSKVIDPSAGSYYIESLTGEIANHAWKQMQEIEAEEGMIKALIRGSIHTRIAATAKQRIDAVNRRKDVFVGVNMYANPDEKAVHLLAKNTPVTDNVFELNAGPLPRLRACMEIEALRNRVLESKLTSNMTIGMLNIGSLPVIKPRMDFSIGFLQAASFEVENPGTFEHVADAVKAFQYSKASAFCICATDDTYPQIIPQLCEALKGKVLVLAGYPADMVETYKKLGIDIFIHLRANLYESMSELVKLMEERHVS